MGIKTLEDLNAKIEEMDEEVIENDTDLDIDEPTPEPEVEEEEVTEEVKEEEGNESKLEEEESTTTSAETSDTTEDTEQEVGTEEESKSPESIDAPYEPDMNFKAMKEEYQLPEYLKGSISNKEQEEEIKKIYSKAHGMEHFQTKNEQLKEVIAGNESSVTAVTAFNAMLDKGDLHSAMKVARIDDDSVLQLASKIIQLRDLTPQQQTDYNNQIQSNHRLHQLEIQNQNLQQQFAQQSETNHLTELDSVMSSNDVSDLASRYDTNAGQAGAFREAVINHAAMLEYQTKDRPEGPMVLSPKEAIDRVVKLSGLQFPNTNQQIGDVGNTIQNKTPTNQTVVVKKDKPTIPNVNAGGKSPVKKKVKSIADLRALADGLDEY